MSSDTKSKSKVTRREQNKHSKKMDELSALDITIRRLTQEMPLEDDLSPF